MTQAHQAHQAHRPQVRQRAAAAARAAVVGWICGLGLLGAARADVVSAVQARAAVATGAVLWDVRPRATVQSWIAGATHLPAAELQARLDQGDRAGFERAVSEAGLDLSRVVVLYGRAGDAQAQALYQALQPVASGRVHWLVGGVDEWQAVGGPMSSQASVRWPVPQHLVSREAVAGATSGRPAAAHLRGVDLRAADFQREGAARSTPAWRTRAGARQAAGLGASEAAYLRHATSAQRRPVACRAPARRVSHVCPPIA